MFKFLKSIFGADYINRPIPYIPTIQEARMAKIEQQNGRFALVQTRSGEVVGTYSRQRDAVRAANRRGLAIS